MKIKINPMTDIGSIIVFTLLFSYALSIASFNPPVSAQVQNNTSLNTADTFALGNASLITDKTIYSQDETVNISLFSVSSDVDSNLTIISPNDSVYIALKEETGFYLFTETTDVGKYLIFANLAPGNKTTTLSTEFEVVGPTSETDDLNISKEVFCLDNASLSVDAAAYVLGETVRISLLAPPEVINNFSMASETGIFYTILPSESGEYRFNPCSAGNYVINVSLCAEGGERSLTATFGVIDLEFVFGEPLQGDVEVGEPVNWSQPISVKNHENFPVSNFSLDIPVPDDCENLSIPIDLAAGESVRFNESYQTSPVRLEVTEKNISIVDLIPHNALDIHLYKQIEEGDEVFSQSLFLSPPIDVEVRYVRIWHNSSAHYRDIPVTIAVDAGERLWLFEVANGTVEELVVDIRGGTAFWIIPELSERLFMVAQVERNQGEAVIDEPVGWRLGVSGIIIEYMTPAPYTEESEPFFEDGAWKKEIVVCSPASVHYTNVTALTTINETAGSDVRLFLLEGGRRVDVTNDSAYEVGFIDENNNSFTDKMQWNVPYLSNRTFEIEQRVNATGDAWLGSSSATPDLRVASVTFEYWNTAENRSSIYETGTGYHVREGRNITINATIANYGDGNATSDFNISFFDSAGVPGNWASWFWNYTYNVSLKGELGNVSMGYPHNTTYATGYWHQSLIGTHNISVWADPCNSTGESAANATNNNGSALINVSAWQKYWGNASGTIVLATSAGNSMVDWEWSSETDTGYIYVVDEGITVNWGALHGLGCDKDDTLNTSGNDFGEADAALKMKPGEGNVTGFIDNNITQLFSGGDPDNAANTTNFIVCETDITNVPIVNSTYMTDREDVENANFTTGILWDRDSGSGADYYDGSQNLVFMTKIQPHKLGLSGVTVAHNYEIGVPSALNATIGGDVDFYVELR